jgi:hypothetical protein
MTPAPLEDESERDDLIPTLFEHPGQSIPFLRWLVEQVTKLACTVSRTKWVDTTITLGIRGRKMRLKAQDISR